MNEPSSRTEWAGLSLDRPRVMAVLNVTPDSFSDGGRIDPDAAIVAGLTMHADGADIVDVGGESTRPGAAPTSPEMERARILPVIRGLAAEGVLISVDTRHAETMAVALDAGAVIVNDISALGHDPASAALIASRNCHVILMHMRGTPATMMGLANYNDVAAEVVTELSARIAVAEQAGIRRDAIMIDPGFGFREASAPFVGVVAEPFRPPAPWIADPGGPLAQGFYRFHQWRIRSCAALSGLHGSRIVRAVPGGRDVARA